MNKTFKVVYNRARAGLMVANEITSSVQKKGVKIIIVATVSGTLAITSGLAFALDHRQDIDRLENQTILGDVSFTDGWGGYLYVGSKDFTSSGNTYSVSATYDKGDGAYGGAIAMYAQGIFGMSSYIGNFKNDKFIGNTFCAIGNNTTTTVDWNAGGAIAVKGYIVNFTDVLFKNNKVDSKVTGTGSVAVGGAVLLDKTIAGTGGSNSAGTIANFIFNKDITYSGNTVTTESPSFTTRKDGGVAYTSGGFLFMDRCSTANFDVKKGVTFTLGILGDTDKNADTIASSMTSDTDAKDYGGHNTITKQGEGTFVVNSSLNDYNGYVDVQAGTMKVNSHWKIRNSVTVSGGSLVLSSFEFSSVEGCYEDFLSATKASATDKGIGSNAKGTITVQEGGTLVIDQAKVGDSLKDAPESSLTVDQGGRLSIANAAVGQIDFGQALKLDGTIVTDNPFVSGAFKDGTITLAGTASEEGMSALASMGIQSMIRRADMVLAETIADRMAGDIETGSNLWVNVRGEHYERDRLDNGAGFKANIGYGAFGAEFAPTDTTTLGVAFQYGNGTVKGDVASVKNKTKDYSFALYGSAMLGGTGVKGVGELAYTKSTNDITSSLALLNQDTDATMLSAGVKAQKTFDVGTFEVTPSLGVRVSHIKTDAMKAGNVDLEKQKQTIVQIPIALRVNARATETAGGWSITPKFKVAYIPTVGDKSIEVFGVKQSVIDTSPVQGSFGVGFAKGNLAIDVAAHLGAGNKGTSAVGGKVGLTYRF